VTYSQPEIEEPQQPAPVPPQQVALRLPDVRPTVTYTIMGVTILVFLLQMATKTLLGYDLPAVLGMKVNEYIQAGEVWRLFTPMLLHSSSMLLHIVFNMYALYAFGPSLERFYGHVGFLTLYVLAGFTGNVLSFLFSPAASLGASTAIFGLLGAEGVFLYQNRKLLGSGAQRALINLITIAALNLVLGFSSGFIDNWGHIGGLIGGTLFAWFGGPLLHVEGMYPQLSLVNGREARQTWTAAAIIALIFGGLALVNIVFL
jgi:rhomboid protease GluP